MISGFLTARAVRIKAKTFMLTAENAVLVAWTSKAFRKQLFPDLSYEMQVVGSQEVGVYSFSLVLCLVLFE